MEPIRAKDNILVCKGGDIEFRTFFMKVRGMVLDSQGLDGRCYEHRPLGKRFKRVTSHLTSDRNTLTNTRYSGTPKSCNHNDTTGKWCHSTLFSHWIISRS